MQKPLLKRWGLTVRGAFSAVLMLTMAIAIHVAERASQMFMWVAVIPCLLMLSALWLKRGYVPRSARSLTYFIMLAIHVVTVLVSGTATWLWALLAAVLAGYGVVLMWMPKGATDATRRSELLTVGVPLIVCYLPFALVGLASVYTGRAIRLPFISSPVGIEADGLIQSRLRIFQNPNSVGRVAVFNLLFCLYGMAVWRERRGIRAALGFALAVHLLTLVHSQSRTCYFALAAAFGVLAFRAVWLRMRPGALRWVTAVAAMAAAAGATLGALDALFAISIRVAQWTSGVGADAALATRAEAEGAFNVYSSGRGDIWPPAVAYIRRHPLILLIGRGLQNPMATIGEEFPQTAQWLNLHNSYLHCVWTGGLPLLAAALAFLCTLVGPSFRRLTAAEQGESRGLYIVAAFLAAMVVMSVPENMLFVHNSFGSVMFMFMLGFLPRPEELG